MFNNHDFSSTTEAKKTHDLHVADLGGLVPHRVPVGTQLAELLSSPPSCRYSLDIYNQPKKLQLTCAVSHISPLRVLLPLILRIMAALDPDGMAAEVGQVLASQQSRVGDADVDSATVVADVGRGLWGNTELDASRLAYCLSRFCDVSLHLRPSLAFQATIDCVWTCDRADV